MTNLLIRIKQKMSERYFEESLLFITVGILSAVVCSFFAKFFSTLEHRSIIFFTEHAATLFILTPMGLVFSFLLVRWFAPGSSGSGIPQVMACIEKSHQHLASIFLTKSVIMIKMISSLVAVFFGAAIGREGPSLQISAGIANNIGLMFQRFKFSVKQEQLLIAGAASGLAAAFNTPIGGIVYAIEELSKEHVRKFKDVLLLSVVISGLTAQLISGNYLYLGYPIIEKNLGGQLLLIVMFVSLFAGILGAIFSKLLSNLNIWRMNKTFLQQIAILILVGVVLALMFNVFGPRALYSGKESINHVLFSRTEISPGEMLARFFGPIISSMTGIAGGIFAPSLATGAVFGGYMAELFDPNMRTILALSGMVGFLNGVTHTPITSFILVLEMTDRHTVVFPMMVAAVISSIGTHLVTKKSFYETMLEKIKENYPANH